MSNNYEPIIVEQSYNASIEMVWAAITEIDQMRQWYFDNIPAFEAKVGFETEFIIENEGRVFPHLWKITEVIPKKKIAYSWKFRGYEGDGLVSFELFETDERTKLKLTSEVIENFPQDIPEFKRESGVAGWNYFIGESLKGYLEGEGENK